MFQKCIFAESVHFNNIYQTDIFWVMSSLEFILGMWVMLNAKSYWTSYFYYVHVTVSSMRGNPDALVLPLARTL